MRGHGSRSSSPPPSFLFFYFTSGIVRPRPRLIFDDQSHNAHFFSHYDCATLVAPPCPSFIHLLLKYSSNLRSCDYTALCGHHRSFRKQTADRKLTTPTALPFTLIDLVHLSSLLVYPNLSAPDTYNGRRLLEVWQLSYVSWTTLTDGGHSRDDPSRPMVDSYRRRSPGKWSHLV